MPCRCCVIRCLFTSLSLTILVDKVTSRRLTSRGCVVTFPMLLVGCVRHGTGFSRLRTARPGRAFLAKPTIDWMSPMDALQPTTTTARSAAATAQPAAATAQPAAATVQPAGPASHEPTGPRPSYAGANGSSSKNHAQSAGRRYNLPASCYHGPASSCHLPVHSYHGPASNNTAQSESAVTTARPAARNCHHQFDRGLGMPAATTSQPVEWPSQQRPAHHDPASNSTVQTVTTCSNEEQHLLAWPQHLSRPG